MDLLTYFSNMCRQLGVHLKTESPSIKTLVSNKKNKNKNGVVARYNFGEFFIDQVEHAGCIILSHTDNLSQEKLQKRKTCLCEAGW